VVTASDQAGTSTVVAFDGTAIHVELRVAAGGSLVVRAVDSAGRPVPDVRVAIDTLPAAAAPLVGLTTDQNGLATYAHVLAGSYAGTARLGTGPSVPFTATVADRASMEARIVIPAAIAPKGK
jgi:hypothetical protein